MVDGADLTTTNDRRGIETFILIDRVGAAAGAVVVLAANALFIQHGLLWLVLAGLVALVIALTLARRSVGSESLLDALLLITAGNWLVAILVSVALPFLWPPMVLTVLMPLVLATPYLGRQMLFGALVAGAFMAGSVGVTGLLMDDGGALPDVDDVFELVLVVGALIALIVPIGFIVWQNNRILRENLNRANELNRELLEIQRELAASRRRVVQAADIERLRIERNLHDGAQQRLVSLGVRLRLLDSQTSDDSPAKPAIATLISELEGSVEEVRELAHGIYPPLLQSRGLGDALRAVARRSSTPVTLELDEVGRLDQSIETALYFTALEALTNAAKHAPESAVTLSLKRVGDSIRLVVADQGPGFDVSDEIRSRGTHNMGDRVAAVQGAVAITSVIGRGTTVEASVPLSMVGDE